MKRYVLFCAGIFLAVSGLYAQTAINGILDSTVSLQAGAGDASAFLFGIEEYANIRFQSRIRDRAVVYGAVNLIAAAGNYAENAASISVYTSGENYMAGIELERLYFRLNFETADFDGGLFRLPFGYGQVWRPSDFLNHGNPLKPDARPLGILGGALSWFPLDDIKLLVFCTAGRDPFSRDGSGMFTGFSLDLHFNKASVQTLYSFETPKTSSAGQVSSKNGIHRAGLSVKADVEVGLVMDVLYSYNHEQGTELDGLSFSFGTDYSVFDGNLIVMAEYLYNGETSSTSRMGGGSFINEHYLYTGLTWRFNDFTNAGIALISSLDDVSFTPIITFNHDLFQGAVLTLTAQIPLDRDLFTGNGKRGELGPLPPGSPEGRYFDFSARLRLRF